MIACSDAGVTPTNAKLAEIVGGGKPVQATLRSYCQRSNTNPGVTANAICKRAAKLKALAKQVLEEANGGPLAATDANPKVGGSAKRKNVPAGDGEDGETPSKKKAPAAKGRGKSVPISEAEDGESAETPSKKTASSAKGRGRPKKKDSTTHTLEEREVKAEEVEEAEDDADLQLE